MSDTTDFEDFQRYFTEYQNRFGLTGYRVYYKHEPDERFACIERNYLHAVATVTLNSEVPEKDKPFQDIKLSAKHEAIHLMLAEYDYMAKNRFASEDDLYAAEEKLVHKLEGLIDG